MLWKSIIHPCVADIWPPGVSVIEECALTVAKKGLAYLVRWESCGSPVGAGWALHVNREKRMERPCPEEWTVRLTAPEKMGLSQT